MKKATANKILAAATPLFAAFGFENVTINQLAGAANVNSAAISYYFGGKKALYQVMLQNQFAPARQALREAEASFRATAAERLLDYAETIAAVKRKQPFLNSLWQYEIFRYQTCHRAPVVKEYTVQLYQCLCSSLCQGISNGEFSPDLHPQNTASILIEIIHAPCIPFSLAMECALPMEGADTDYAVFAVHHYLQGIRRVPLPAVSRLPVQKRMALPVKMTKHTTT